MKQIFFLMALVWLMAGFGLAQNRPSEADMFGGDSSTPTPAVQTAPSGSTQIPASRDSEEMTSKSHALLTSAEENTQIGGTLSTEADYYIQKGTPLDQDLVSNPNILFLYLDSKLENDNRVFARIRTFYDPTGLSSGTPTASSYTNPYGLGNGTSDNLSTQLQELRISANIDHEIFLTIGRQKVKYGAAKFFNPTDFLNSQLYDFFLPSDERTGVDMVKAQVPIGTASLTAAGLTGDPTNGNSAGGYFRGELGYDSFANILESGEISLSGYLPKGQAGRGGFDISQGVGDLDAYFEGAIGQIQSGTWQGGFSTGADWETRYGSRQTDTVTFEAEFSDFPFPVTIPGTLVQTYTATQFGVFAIDLANPVGWTDLTFAETNIYDFNYKSGFSRLDAVCQLTDRISGRVYVSASWGQQGGAFSESGQLAQTGARMDVNF
jgi:hypothetical protein